MESISFAAEMRAGGVLFVYNKEKMQRPQLYLIVMHGLEGGGAADMASGGRWLCHLDDWLIHLPLYAVEEICKCDGIRKSPSAIVHSAVDFLVIPSYRLCKFLTIFPA